MQLAGVCRHTGGQSWLGQEPSFNFHGCRDCGDEAEGWIESYIFSDVAEVGTEAEKLSKSEVR